jgi:hypothetical protein
MSRIVVNFDEVENKSVLPAGQGDVAPKAPPKKMIKKRSVWRTIFKTVLFLFLAILIVGGTAGYFYWQSYKKTPAYSLALVVEAARKDDKQALGRLVDTDKVVDAFVPQITDKAVELYGRGMPQGVIQELARVAAPVLPAIKEHARAELPRMIREKTKKLENVPFFLVALGASQALEIREEGDTAWVKSTVPERPLELKMQRNGDVWQVVEVKDEELARKIAEQIGQQIIAAANAGIDRTGDALGIPNLNEMLKKAEEVFK